MVTKRHPMGLPIGNQKQHTPTALTDAVIHDYLRDLNCPRALSVWILYNNKEHIQLLELEANPLDYNSSEVFRVSYMASMFLSKADFLVTGLDKRASAIEKFFRMEDHCKMVNKNLIDDKCLSTDIGSRILRARRIISSILGSFNPAELMDSSCWGPGSTTLIKGSHRSWADKFQFETGLSRDFFEFSKDWLSLVCPRCDWGRHESVTFCNSNQLLTVPKNSKIDRVIAVEPGINLYFQKAIGTAIRKRLRTRGLDLNKGDRIHRELARLSSLDGSLATIDFSSASDTISKRVVELLLPRDWFLVMDALRSKGAIHEGRWVHWAKFSSMGNGFTFELETIIFYALALACVEEGQHHSVSVYGDDVILPSISYPAFESVATHLGFIVNPKKSFSSGRFRESCGGHFFDGICCKPFYLKSRITSLRRCMIALNGVFRSQFLAPSTCWRNLLRTIPSRDRFFGPSNLGDSVIHSPSSWWSPRKQFGWDGFFFLGRIHLSIMREVDFEGLLTSKLLALQLSGDLPDKSTDTSSGNDLPSGRERCCSKWLFVSARELIGSETL